jgi:rod shape-determining protein MreC
MRSLFRFLLRYHFIILVLLLEILSLSLVIQYNNYPGTAFLNSSNKVAGRVYAGVNSINQYLNLKTENQMLLAELASFRQNMPQSFKDNSGIEQRYYDSLISQQYLYIPAQVVNNSVNKQNNHLTLNKGSRQGVKPQMGVVSATGAVGIVKDVSENYASVISILNQNVKVSAMHKASGYFGSLSWDGLNRQHALLSDLPSHVKLMPGDTIITSGYSAVFPKGVLLGFVVVDDDDSQSGEFLLVKVELAVDFSNLENVMVVSNLFAAEQLELEQKSAHD